MEKAAAEAAAKQATDKQAADAESRKVAALSPPPSSLPPGDLAKSVQSELRRVGCLSAAPDGDWNAATQRSLTLFNKYAGTQFDAKLASIDALDALKAKPGRVCPLVCNFGFKADGDQCAKITCRAGYRVGDDNECEKIQEKKPVATREDSRRRDSDRKNAEVNGTKVTSLRPDDLQRRRLQAGRKGLSPRAGAQCERQRQDHRRGLQLTARRR